MTDVMHVETKPIAPTDRVEVQEIGDKLGLPGLILVRFNPDTGETYGFTIQRFSHVRRKMMWQDRTLQAKQAVDRLVARLQESWGESHSRHLALSH